MSITPDRDTVVFTSHRQAHDKTEVPHTFTVSELIGYLEWLNPDARVYIEGYDGHLCNALTDYEISGGE